MTESSPDILALDFDGVICDGLIEYFQTAWQAYCDIWTLSERTPPDGLAERFYALRPVVETGWEMPVLLRSLLLGSTDEEVLADWQAIAHQRVDIENLNTAELAAAVDGVRDQWIQRDPDQWLSLHRFYPGVIEKLRQILAGDTQVYIISTKEGRFIQQLLAREELALAEDRILGKEVKRPKDQTLRALIRQWVEGGETPPSLWFVEDRLKTLQIVQSHPDLAEVHLFLAAWGYNTQADRDRAQADPRIHLLTLEQFAQDFAQPARS
ncbi:MAG: HAD family hydrolase [Synechococcales bacterium]|nr:HAD family hydrolase [Synechococcales bacterium]